MQFIPPFLERPGHITQQGSDKSCSKEASCFPDVLGGRIAGPKGTPREPTQRNDALTVCAALHAGQVREKDEKPSACLKGLSQQGAEAAWY